MSSTSPVSSIYIPTGENRGEVSEDLIIRGVNDKNIELIKQGIKAAGNVDLGLLNQSLVRVCVLANNTVHNEDLRDYITIMELLLEAGADPNTTDKNGSTLLILTCEAGNLDGMKMILNQRAVLLDAQNLLGHTALMMACNVPNIEMIQLLMKKGANPSLTDVNGNTAFNYAALWGIETQLTLTNALTEIP